MNGISLRRMQVNQTGTIVSVKATDELGRRIRDMGLVPGKEIRIQGRAPLNDRCPADHGGTLTLKKQ